MGMDKEELKRRQIANGYNHIGNLKKWDDMSPEELKAIKQKGQKATVEIVKQKKRIKDITESLLNMSASDIASNVLNEEIAEKLKGTDITLYDLIIAKQIEVALTSGSVKSAEFLRDSNGDKPTDKVQTDITVMTDSDRQLIEMLSDRIEVLEDIADGKIVDND